MGMKWTVSDNARLNDSVPQVMIAGIRFTGLCLRSLTRVALPSLELELDWALSETGTYRWL